MSFKTAIWLLYELLQHGQIIKKFLYDVKYYVDRTLHCGDILQIKILFVALAAVEYMSLCICCCDGHSIR